MRKKCEYRENHEDTNELDFLKRERERGTPLIKLNRCMSQCVLLKRTRKLCAKNRFNDVTSPLCTNNHGTYKLIMMAQWFQNINKFQNFQKSWVHRFPTALIHKLIYYDLVFFVPEDLTMPNLCLHMFKGTWNIQPIKYKKSYLHGPKILHKGIFHQMRTYKRT